MADNFSLSLAVTANAENAKAQLKDLTGKIEKLSADTEKTAEKSVSAYAAMTKGMRDLNGQVNSARDSLNRLIAVGAAVTFAKSLTQTADAWSGLNARIKLVSGTTQEYATAMNQVYEISQRNNVALADSAKLYARLAPIAQDLGRSQQEVMSILAGVSASLKVSGASAAEASSTITQLTQALASQTVQWSDFGMLLDTNPALVRAVSKELGGAIAQFGSLKDAMSKGGISNQQLFDAIIKVSGGFELQASKILTVSGAMTQLSNAWTKYIGDGDQANQTSRELAEGISTIAKNMETVLIIPSTVVHGWALILDTITQVRIALGSLSAYKNQFGINSAISLSEWQSRRGSGPSQAASDSGQYSTGGGFGGEESQKTPYFDGRSRAAASSSSKIITEASKRLGERETGAGSADLVKFLNEHSGTVFNNLTVPWCARYVSAVLDSSGVGGLKTARAKDYLGFGESVWKQGQGNSALSNVQPGDIAIFTRSGGGGHVGFVKAADPNRGTLDVLGGNQSNSVSVSHRSTAGLLAIRRATGKVSDVDSAEKAIKAEADAWKKSQDDAYKQFADRIDRQGKLQDAQSATEKARRLAQVDQIQAAADKAEKASTITIKTALDQTGIEAGMRAIDAAEKKQADYLRQANAAASGNAEVQSAQREIAALDAKIKKARQYGQDESDLLNQRAIAEESLKQSQIKAGQDNLTLQKSLAENHAKYDALRKSANEDELKFQDARKAYETQVNQATADGQKQAIDAALQRYQLALSAREVERQQLLANKTGAAYAEQQMANEQASRQDQVNLIDAERQATQQKLAIDQQVLQIQAAALQQQLAGTADREKQLDLSRQLAQVNAGIAANAGQQQAAGYSAAGKIGQIYSDVAAKNDQRNIQQVEEAQLRLNQAMQESVQQAQLAAQHMTDAFGATGASIGQLVTSVAQFGQQMMQVNRDAASAIEQMRKNGSYSPEKAYEVQDAAAKKSMQYQVSLFGTLTQAASGFFGHASKGYTALQTAAKVFRAVEMGLAVQSAVLQIGQMVTTMAADEAQTAASVANTTVRAQAKGAEAVVSQGAGGDPVSAIPRMIAMGAMVATILGGIGMAVAGAVGGGGGVTPPNPEDIQKAAGTGTVLGDASAQSQSISESLKLLTDNSTADLSYSADMLAALQSIDAGMRGLSVSIYGGIKSPTLSARQIKSGKSIVDFGIIGNDQTVASLLSKGLSGQVYNDLQKMSTGGLMGGGSTVQWVKEFTGALPKNISDQFGRVMQSVVSSLGTAAGGLGLDGSLSKALGSTKVNVGRISLQGLSASQINDEISAVVGSIGDTLARKAIPGLKDFQKAGEGYYQTVVRVVQGTQEAGGELDQLGLKAISFRDVLNKQGDVSAEIVRQTVLAQEGLGAGARAYVSQLNESSKDLIGTVKTIRETVAALRAGGFSTDFTQAEVNAAGGLSALLSSLNDFNSKFLPASSQTEGKWRSMADSFTRLGLKMPTTNAGFVDLVRGIDQSTIAGQKLFGQVVSLSSAFYDMTDAMSQATKDVQTAYDRQKALALSLADYVRTLGATDASASPASRYAATQANFNQALSAAKSGDETAQKNLQSVAQAYLDASRAYNGSTAAYAQDVQAVSSGLSGVADIITAQVSAAEQQVSALDRNSGAVLSLADAINRYLQQASTAGAIAAGQQAGTASVAEVNAGNNATAAADAAYKASAAYRQQRQDAADKFTHDINWWLKQSAAATSAAVRDKDIAAANSLIQQAYASPFSLAVSQIKGGNTGRVSDDRYTVSLRAKGGYTPAGYVLAGEHGPELMRFDRPSQVMTADETRQILQGGDPKALGQLAESVRSSITDIGKAGIKVDQAGYQALIKLLSSIDARMAAVESSRKLAGAA